MAIPPCVIVRKKPNGRRYLDVVVLSKDHSNGNLLKNENEMFDGKNSRKNHKIDSTTEHNDARKAEQCTHETSNTSGITLQQTGELGKDETAQTKAQTNLRKPKIRHRTNTMDIHKSVKKMCTEKKQSINMPSMRKQVHQPEVRPKFDASCKISFHFEDKTIFDTQPDSVMKSASASASASVRCTDKKHSQENLESATYCDTPFLGDHLSPVQSAVLVKQHISHSNSINVTACNSAVHSISAAPKEHSNMNDCDAVIDSNNSSSDALQRTRTAHHLHLASTESEFNDDSDPFALVDTLQLPPANNDVTLQHIDRLHTLSCARRNSPILSSADNNPTSNTSNYVARFCSNEHSRKPNGSQIHEVNIPSRVQLPNTQSSFRNPGRSSRNDSNVVKLQQSNCSGFREQQPEVKQANAGPYLTGSWRKIDNQKWFCLSNGKRFKGSEGWKMSERLKREKEVRRLSELTFTDSNDGLSSPVRAQQRYRDQFSCYDQLERDVIPFKKHAKQVQKKNAGKTAKEPSSKKK